VHEATIHATALLNLHVRRCIREGVAMHRLFDGNWLIEAFQEVTTGDKSPSVDLELSNDIISSFLSHDNVIFFS
jgi:hypothetical protein